MVVRSLTKKLKNKPKKTRGEVFLINMKYFGDEPKFDHKDLNESDIGRAYNWYNYMEGVDEAKEYVTLWLSENRKELLVKFKSFNHFPLNWGWSCRLMNNGYNLPEGYKERMLEKIASYIQPQENFEVKTPTMTRKKNYIDDLEGIVDENDSSFRMYDYILSQEISKPNANQIREYYVPILDEWKQVVENKDPQIKEAYSHMSLSEKKARLGFFQRMIDDIDRFCENRNKMRKPRKKKAQNFEKLVSGFQYLKEDSTHNLVSIEPIRIFDSIEVYLWNRKYSTLTKLTAAAEKKLMVKGTTIYNVDESKSQTKRIGRKLNMLGIINKEGKRFINRQWEEIKTSSSLQKRGNEDTVILRVF